VEPVLAETLAALRAAEFCRNRGLQNIIMVGDSLQVVQALNKSGQNLTKAWASCC
jgi:ribonuclease HI